MSDLDSEIEILEPFLNLNPHYAIEMHLHNLTNENQTLTLKNIFPIG
jgi:hypothetical protein